MMTFYNYDQTHKTVDADVETDIVVDDENKTDSEKKFSDDDLAKIEHMKKLKAQLLGGKY